MIKLKNKKVGLFYIILTDIFLLDFFSKWIIDKSLQLNETIRIIPNILSFEKVYNEGAAFSILQNNIELLIIISITTILYILGYFIKKHSEFSYANIVALACIAGGAMGNLFDRITYSHVIDFIQLDFLNFPIFNLADIFINIGVIILIINILVAKNDK